MKTNPELLNFIKEARKKGYQDYQIKEILVKHNWPSLEIEKAFEELKPKSRDKKLNKSKNVVSLYLDTEVLENLQKRAKKNLFSVEEQIEDILRRSCVNQKKQQKQEDKLDDYFISLFSRRRSGKQRKV